MDPLKRARTGPVTFQRKGTAAQMEARPGINPLGADSVETVNRRRWPPMASNLLAMASNLRVMASNLVLGKCEKHDPTIIIEMNHDSWSSTMSCGAQKEWEAHWEYSCALSNIIPYEP